MKSAAASDPDGPQHAHPLDPASLGPQVLVIVPHPDDEAIGCGGLIAVLRRAGVPVELVLLSDGEMSHPSSRRWTPAQRAALRRSEFIASLAVLGVDEHAVTALGWPDGALPGPRHAGFAAAAATLAQRLRAQRCTSVVVPWRRDSHADHRAAHALALAAMTDVPQPLRVLEYPVWTAERGAPADHPQAGEVTWWTLAIADVLAIKLRALAAHRSQFGGVIDDDPEGFTLPASMLERCARPWETFYEARSANAANATTAANAANAANAAIATAAANDAFAAPQQGQT